MNQFDYTIQDVKGIHARPASQIVKIAKEYADTVITMERDGKSADATQLMSIMSLGIREDDVITVKAEGSSEDAAIEALRTFIEANL
ncbi:MAG: HPr family phosphocarrier protein [Oscillospiraceae bacterium]|nr:HPr family phosphocarrier protein [Oscillospiraceae bacterium]